MAAAFIQQSLEHFRAAVTLRERTVFVARLIFSALLIVSLGCEIAGIDIPKSLHFIALPAVVSSLLMASQIALLILFDGPYNGGADRMGTLILSCVTIAWVSGSTVITELAFGYLSIQLTLSYLISGWVKIANLLWRSGQALRGVFAVSVYPVSEDTRCWAERPGLLLAMSWAVMIFELSFPLALASSITLKGALVIAACFHGANAMLFGLNRFFWIWLSAYPAILWFQERLQTF